MYRTVCWPPGSRFVSSYFHDQPIGPSPSGFFTPPFDDQRDDFDIERLTIVNDNVM